MRAAAILTALCVAAVFLLYVRPVRIVPRGSAIVHDDFQYTVRDLKVRSVAHQVVYDVTILIENHAKRVPYAWRDDIAYAVDDRGRPFRPVSHNALKVAPGSTVRMVVRFIVPADARRLVLRFWDGILMGDVFDGAQYARATVALY